MKFLEVIHIAGARARVEGVHVQAAVEAVQVVEEELVVGVLAWVEDVVGDSLP